jgi:hypothetical protein
VQTTRFTGGHDSQGKSFSLRNVMVTTRIKILLSKGKPYYILHSTVKGSIAEIVGMDQRLVLRYIKQLEKKVESDTQLRITDLIYKLQSLHSDVIDFGAQLRAQHYDLWKRINWKKVYPTVPFRVTVQAKIIRDGLCAKEACYYSGRFYIIVSKYLPIVSCDDR